ncbi:MAG: alpha/beta hydrolase family protein [Promethearchaeota archaeon]
MIVIISKKQSTVLEETEFIIVDEMTNKDHSDLKKILIFILVLVFSLSFLHFNKIMSYEKYDRIQFESSGAMLYANLYYPSKTLDFQEKRPLVIYCHGIGSKRDFDLRIPIEVTKRGYYVAALDYQGHGESGGNINNINPYTGIPALAQDCSKLLDKLETLPFYSNVNISQVGLIGHSLGGMVVLMNQALDPRFKVSVALAPLVNFIPPKFGFNEDFNTNYIPVNLLNNENTQNLLIIHHINDEILDYSENALKAKDLTNCSVITVYGFLLGGAHQLFTNEVLIKSINWLELHFFGSTMRNGPIIITFYLNYILIFMNIILIFTLLISLISVSSRIFFRKRKEPENFDIFQDNLLNNTSNKRKESVKVILYTTGFLLNWLIFEKIFGIIGIIYSSISMIVIFIFKGFHKYFKKSKLMRDKYNLKSLIRIQFNSKYLIFTISSVFYFIANYMMFSFYYPFGFIWPSDFVFHFVLGYLVFPVFFAIEILLRKIIYPKLSYIKHKNSVLLIIAVMIMISLMLMTQKLSLFPSVLFMFLIFFLVILLNTKIFENVKSFYPIVLISFSIIQIFFASVLSNAIGVSMVI